MPLIYREMTIEDIDASFEVRLSTIENAVTMDEIAQDYGITPDSLAVSMASDVRGWICEDEGRAVGYAMGDRSHGEVTVVAVRPGYEGRGIGRAVLARVEAWLFSQGHDEIWLLANPDPGVRAHGFYRKFGWRGTDERRHGDEVMKLAKSDHRTRR